jgi:hypothetical protein
VSEQQEQENESSQEMAGARIISYNFTEDERPGGMRVRAKIRVVTGRQAQVVNAAQAEVIRELLEWVRQQRRQQSRRD